MNTTLILSEPKPLFHQDSHTFTSLFGKREEQLVGHRNVFSRRFVQFKVDVAEECGKGQQHFGSCETRVTIVLLFSEWSDKARWDERTGKNGRESTYFCPTHCLDPLLKGTR